jgi:hypothetical protein
MYQSLNKVQYLQDRTGTYIVEGCVELTGHSQEMRIGAVQCFGIYINYMQITDYNVNAKRRS